MQIEDPTDGPPSNAWVIDRRVPLATIAAVFITILLQTGAIIWWAAKIESRVASLETDAMLDRINRDKVTNLEGDIAGINSKLNDIKVNDLADIKKTLEHLIWEKHGQRPHGE
ncbi:hypothetical protein ACYOEI_24705 [Singulisphaera rosea]